MGKRKTTLEFIKESKEVHGDKYDYSNVKYINNRVKVRIICPIHGEFLQTPYSHLNGNGCKKCFDGIRGKSFILTTEQFIEKAKAVHRK